MKEFNTRQEAKNRAEHLTPVVLREFLSKKVQGNDLKVLEPAIGSGQLLFNLFDRVKSIDGYDVSENVIKQAKENFKDKASLLLQDFITSKNNNQYDVAIANYPFSLMPSQEQKEAIAKDSFLSQFYVKQKGFINTAKADDVKGKLDYIFILKSFNLAKEGLYLCFPGIGYRGEEEKFRKYLIDNKFIKEFGILKNSKFENTNIDIFFLHLTKEPNEKTKAFSLDFKTNEFLEEEATFENNQFKYPIKVIEKEFFDAVELERQSRENLINVIKKELATSRMIYDLDVDIRKGLPTIEEFKKDIIDLLNEC